MEEPGVGGRVAGDRALDAAIEHHRAGRLDQAMKLYAGILDRNSRHPEALHLLGVLKVQQGDLVGGRALIEKAIAELPKNAEYRASLARVWLLSGDDERAEQCYRDCLAAAPNHVSAWINLGNLLLKADRMDAAADCFQRALQVDPNLVEGHEGLGIVQQRQGQTAAAVGAFERALALNPDNALARANLGGLLFDTGNFDAAVAHLKRAAAMVPGRPDILTNLAVALHSAGRYEEALGHYDAALRLAPGNARTIGAKGLSLAALGRHAEAASVFDHERLIVSKHIEQIPGFVDLKSFNEALAGQILANPSLVSDRAGKSTRGGSQTGELLRDPTGALAALQGILRARCDEYFEQIARTGHPYRPVRPAHSRITAWATVLEAGGHQDSHNHPSGALSGVYYVRLPDIIRAGQGRDDEGCIEFGLPSEKLWNEAPINPRTLRPEEGRLILFPSHFWHRTIPFEDNRHRISIAFDLISEGRPGA